MISKGNGDEKMSLANCPRCRHEWSPDPTDMSQGMNYERECPNCNTPIKISMEVSLDFYVELDTESEYQGNGTND